MPSPASSTVPVSMTETFWSKLSISLRMIWLISSARICMVSFLSLLLGLLLGCLVDELLPQVGQLGADAAVQHQVTHLGDDPPDERGVDRDLHDHLLAGPLFQRAAHPLEGGGRQLLG